MSNNKFKVKKRAVKFKTTSLNNKIEIDDNLKKEYEAEEKKQKVQKSTKVKEVVEDAEALNKLAKAEAEEPIQDDILNKPIKKVQVKEVVEGADEVSAMDKGRDNKLEVTPISTNKLSESTSIIDDDLVKKPLSVLFIFYVIFQILVISFLGWMLYRGLVSIEVIS